MIDLYTWPTPNGRKVSIALEEMGLAYNCHGVNLQEQAQFAPEFLLISPNNKIPALVDHESEQRLMESGAILVYLADKVSDFWGEDRYTTLQWLMWQMGSAPYLGGGFGHFYAYAPEKFEYPIDRFAMEVKRQLDVLDKHLSNKNYLCGNEYTIADIATYPWYGACVLHNIYSAAEFLDVESYTHVIRWAKEIEARPAVERGRRVNRPWGPEETRVLERHSASDFDN